MSISGIGSEIQTQWSNLDDANDCLFDLSKKVYFEELDSLILDRLEEDQFSCKPSLASEPFLRIFNANRPLQNSELNVDSALQKSLEISQKRDAPERSIYNDLYNRSSWKTKTSKNLDNNSYELDAHDVNDGSKMCQEILCFGKIDPVAPKNFLINALPSKKSYKIQCAKDVHHLLKILLDELYYLAARSHLKYSDVIEYLPSSVKIVESESAGGDRFEFIFLHKDPETDTDLEFLANLEQFKMPENRAHSQINKQCIMFIGGLILKSFISSPEMILDLNPRLRRVLERIISYYCLKDTSYTTLKLSYVVGQRCHLRKKNTDIRLKGIANILRQDPSLISYECSLEILETFKDIIL